MNSPAFRIEGMLVDIDAERLRWFVAVTEEESFGRAAKALRISRQALSHTIIDLEAETGMDLFEPGSAPPQLTDAGRGFLDDARIVIAQDDAVRREHAALTAAPPKLRIGFVEGVTLTKWTRRWEERFPSVALKVKPIVPEDFPGAVTDGFLDIAFVRLPVDGDGLNVVPLYVETTVVILPKDHEATAYDEVELADLAAEHLLQDPDDVPEWRDIADEIRDDDRLPLPPMESVADAIELVAAGGGILIVPQSIARLHARKDVVFLPVLDAPQHQVAVTWSSENTNTDIDEFVGIVRGRSERSSRSVVASDKTSAPRKAKPDAKNIPSPHKPAAVATSGKAKATPGQKRRGGKSAKRAKRH